MTKRFCRDELHCICALFCSLLLATPGRVVNATREVHPFHIHQVHFLAYAINGVASEMPEWLDTVNVPYGGTVDVWTFCAIDSETKLVPSFKVGKRTHQALEIRLRLRNIELQQSIDRIAQLAFKSSNAA